MVEKKITEIDAMKHIDELLSKIDDKDARDRIVNWAKSKFGANSIAATGVIRAQSGTSSRKTKSKKARKKKGKSKAPDSISVDKNLNLRPKGKKSFVDFTKEKDPKSILEKYVVCVYYLKNELGIKEVSLSQIFTCFKEARWKHPSDYVNALHQTGTEGWLETGDQSNIAISSRGNNLIEHDLPRRSQKKGK